MALPVGSLDRSPAMLKPVSKTLGWIFGPIFALFIVLMVRFFERSLRFDTRRDPAWRSQ